MTRWTLAWACVVGMALPACGTDDPEMDLLTAASWNADPASVAETGYWISVDFGWPERAKSCFPLPRALHVTVDGREATKNANMGGDCLWDVLYELGPFPSEEPQPTVVRVLDGEKLLGSATYRGLFPGYPAQLMSPADGRVRLGDSIVLGLLAPLPADASFFGSAEYFWLDASDGVPPYQQYAQATLATDRQSITVATPDRTGRAALIASSSFSKEYTPAESCEGFAHCTSLPSAAIGPVLVEVVP
jgi:hypothetical protein